MSWEATRKRTVAGVLTAACLAGVGLAPGAVAEARLAGDQVLLPIAGGLAMIKTGSLEVTALTPRRLVLSAPAAGDLGPAGPVSRRRGEVRWSYPAKGLEVRASTERGRLVVSLRSDRDGALTWPVSGTDPATTSVQFPRGEGLSVPVADPWWNSPASGLAGSASELAGGLTMPFWGYTLGGVGVSYLVPTDIGTSLRFASTGGRLRTETEHTFGNGTRDYTVTFALTDSSPVASALDYRRWLSARGDLSRLRDKIAANPEVGKLIGAFHAYLWGRARTPEGVRQLRSQGLSRMWLGYDADDSPMSAEAVAAAKEAGYLVGPYDSWANAQDPKTADNPYSVWPAPLWPAGCVQDSSGKPVVGFGGRGCYLSSQALAAAGDVLSKRADTVTANGATGYFLDVDAAGELFDDYSPAHPMTKAQDRANRLARLGLLAKDRKVVLGSETAGGWANSVLSYSHGSATPVTDQLWELERDKERWGGYSPWNAPAFFFKPVRLPAEVAKAMFDPAYRVPLYQTALHDSVISLDRWELPLSKLPDQRDTRVLLAMLNNTPLNLVLNGTETDTARIAELQRYFAPLHQAAATEPMTGFDWLSADRLVQRSTFGSGALTVTANFGTQAYGSLPAGCVDASVPADRTPRRWCSATR